MKEAAHAIHAAVFNEGYAATAGEGLMRWDRRQIAEGLALLDGVVAEGALGAYAVQAAIAAAHARAARAADTDWKQIAALYALLARLSPSPVVELNRAVAVAMADGPEDGLRILDAIDAS